MMPYVGLKPKIPLGESGILTDIAADKAPPDSLLQATNICYFNGAVQKAPGSLAWNSTPLTTGIVAVHHWIPDIRALQLTRMIAVTSNGNIYKGRDRVFNAPVNATISTLTPNCVFAEGGAEQAANPRKLFLFTDGQTLPYVLSGDAGKFNPIAFPAADWTSTGTYPKFGLVHRNQLWAFAGQISYASSSGNHEDFQNVTTTMVEPVYPGEGGQLRGAFVFKSKLFCFKDGGFVYGLNDSDTSSSNWYWQKVASSIGLAAPNAAAEGVEDLYVGNTYGTISSFQATLALGNVAAADVAQNNGFEKFLRLYTSKSGVPYEHMMYYSEKKLLFMTVRSTYQTTNDSLLVLDFARQRVRTSLWTKGQPQCLAKYKDMFQVERPMYGGADGVLYLMDYADRSEGTAAYTGAFQTNHLDFSFLDPSLAATEKLFDSLAVHYVPSSAAAQLSCDYYIDGRYIETLQFPLAQYKRPTLGTITLGQDRLAAGNTETAQLPLHGAGKTISFYFYNSGSNQSFQVPAITVYFRPGGDKAQQT